MVINEVKSQVDGWSIQIRHGVVTINSHRNSGIVVTMSHNVVRSAGLR